MFNWITAGLFALALAVGSASFASAGSLTGGCCDGPDKGCKKECCKDGKCACKDCKDCCKDGCPIKKDDKK